MSNNMLKTLKNKYPFLYHIYRIIPNMLDDYRDYKREKYWSSLTPSQYPDILSQKYEEIFNYRLDWNNLINYTEKMQWDKLYNKDPRKTTLSDKYLVREWVSSRIGSNYLVPLLGVWNNANEINWNLLPNCFILKTNKGSGDSVIVKDKSVLNKYDILDIKRKLNKSLKKNYAFSASFEMQYANIVPKIIAEELIGENVADYKFLCFNGKPYWCWVDLDRFTAHKRNIYDLDWNKCDWEQCYPSTDTVVPKPKNFDKMVELVTILCQDFAHVRVDLYNVDGQIYFGEMTFSSGSGYENYNPPIYNKILGDLWTLDKRFTE